MDRQKAHKKVIIFLFTHISKAISTAPHQLNRSLFFSLRLLLAAVPSHNTIYSFRFEFYIPDGSNKCPSPETTPSRPGHSMTFQALGFGLLGRFCPPLLASTPVHFHHVKSIESLIIPRNTRRLSAQLARLLFASCVCRDRFYQINFRSLSRRILFFASRLPSPRPSPTAHLLTVSLL